MTKYHKHEPDFNKALQDMGNHYHFVAQACRPRKPTDKAQVESAVRRIYNRVYSQLRHQVSHSIGQLNEALAKATLEHNQTRMQRKPYSRQECFIASEKDELQPLPDTPFELICTAELTVQMNCHIYMPRDKKYYSVSYLHVGKKATVCYTRSIVRIYVDNYRRRAPAVAPGLGEYINAVFDDGLAHGFAVECRYNTCNGIIANAKKYQATVMEQSCMIAIDRSVFSSRKQERIQGHAVRFLDKLAKTDLLILDDFGMKKLQGQQQNDFEQLIGDRYRKKGLIISSQLPVKDWYDVIGNELIAEACLDRLVHKYGQKKSSS